MTGPNLRTDSHFYKDMDSWICITQKIAATLSLCAFYRLAGGRREYFWKKYTKKTWRHFCVHACTIENNWTTTLLYNRVQNTLIVFCCFFFSQALFVLPSVYFFKFYVGNVWMSGCLDLYLGGKKNRGMYRWWVSDRFWPILSTLWFRLRCLHYSLLSYFICFIIIIIFLFGLTFFHLFSSHNSPTPYLSSPPSPLSDWTMHNGVTRPTLFVSYLVDPSPP